MDGSWIVAGTVFADSVKFVIEQTDSSVRPHYGLRKFSLATCPRWQQTSNLWVHDNFVVGRYHMAPFTNPQRKPRTQSDGTELIQTSSRNANVVVRRTLLSRCDADKYNFGLFIT